MGASAMITPGVKHQNNMGFRDSITDCWDLCSRREGGLTRSGGSISLLDMYAEIWGDGFLALLLSKGSMKEGLVFVDLWALLSAGIALALTSGIHFLFFELCWQLS